MLATLHYITAALYLGACLGAVAGLVLRRARVLRVGVALLAVGATAHAVSFTALHAAEAPPPLTDLPSAMSFMAWIGVLGFFVLARRRRLSGLVVLVAPAAFLGVFAEATGIPGYTDDSGLGSGSLPHAHVVLAGAGVALLGVSGLAGILFLAEHRRLKTKRPLGSGSPLPSLEALDRAGALSLAAGFPLLSLGVLAGAFWLQSATGAPWSGSAHEIWCLVAWSLYAVLASLRFGARWPARQCALSAVVSFAVLTSSVVGVGLLT